MMFDESSGWEQYVVCKALEEFEKEAFKLEIFKGSNVRNR